MKKIIRRLKGALGNALVWAMGWFAAGWVIATAVYLLDSRTFWSLFLSNALSYSLTMAVVGFVTGGAFSAYIAAAFRNSELDDLSPVRFALGGSLVATLVTVVGVSGLMIGTNGYVLISWLITPALLSAGLGAVTGFGSLKMAKRELPPGAQSTELESEERPVLT